jgi:hypothetical protein
MGNTTTKHKVHTITKKSLSKRPNRNRNYTTTRINPVKIINSYKPHSVHRVSHTRKSQYPLRELPILVESKSILSKIRGPNTFKGTAATQYEYKKHRSPKKNRSQETLVRIFYPISPNKKPYFM